MNPKSYIRNHTAYKKLNHTEQVDRFANNLIIEDNKLDIEATLQAAKLTGTRSWKSKMRDKYGLIDDDYNILITTRSAPAKTPVDITAIAVEVPGSKAPRAKVPTERPDSQNHYSMAVWNSHDLTSTQKLILMGMAIEFGAEKGRSGKDYADCTKAAAKDYIVGHAKVSDNTADKQMKTLVEMGWLRRTDNGVGGRGGKNPATYAPTMPRY